MHPHRFDPLSKRILLDRRIYRVLRRPARRRADRDADDVLLQAARRSGQAFHQDNFYLQVKPGTCIAAWIAVDPAIP